ncbi:MAG: hypothetical protein DRJ13_11810 [Bacteroidetes bacterium]|nr:MAG: hypothetical protein DRJ13_11810 [Bacteroidota bacterium]
MMKKIMPTTYLLVAIILCVAFHNIFPIRFLIPSKWNLTGLIPLLFGVWINLAADKSLKFAETTVKPYEESNALVQDGVFRFSRNPMYLGFISILVGISLLLKSLSPYFVVIIFAVLIDQVFIKSEERMLKETFAEVWSKY